MGVSGVRLPRLPRFPRHHRSDEPDATKAAGGPGVGRGQTFSAAQVAAMINAVSVAPQVPGTTAPLPRTDPQVAFGPGMPLFPASIDPVRDDTGRPEPRIYEYPVSVNLPGVTDKLVPWKVLRDAAEAGGLPRRCIELRKAEVSTLDWAVTISQGAVEQAQADAPGTARADVETDLRQRLAPEIARCEAFWAEPDPGQGENFPEWISKLLEEHLVLDAVAVYPRYTYGGGLSALEIIAGDTIKALLDHRGGRPLPPQPAYQQILWGFPRGEFVADIDGDGNVLNGYRADQLIYKRRNVRATSPYGYSAVEQALEDIDVWLRRRQWIKAAYTEGTVPAGWIKVPENSAWTVQQVREYERNLNDVLGGQTAERHRMRMLPPGFEAETFPDEAEKYKPEYDLFLIKQVVSHFDSTIAELGYTESKGLGSAGWHEGQADVQHRKALSTLRWLQALLTSISRKHLGMPAELEFRFLGLEEEDEAAADAVADLRVKSGRMTYNEDRDRLGLPRYEFAEADMPTVVTTRGVVFLEGASQQVPPGETVSPPQAPSMTDSNLDGVADVYQQDQQDQDAEDQENPDDEKDADDRAATGTERAGKVKAELAAFYRWTRRNPGARRPFQFEVVTKADAPELAADPRAVLKAVDAGPKVESAKQWPGWDRDQDTAAVWASRIRKTMRDAVNTRGLAERWLATQLVKDDEPDLDGLDQPDGPAEPDTYSTTDTVTWLIAQGVSLTAALGFVPDLWAEGYAIGQQSATAVLAGSATVDWSAWTPGDAQAARLVLDENGRNGLRLMLDQAGVTITSIAGNRLDQLAGALSDALANGDSADTLAGNLTDILDDPAWADMVATTELARAISVSTLGTYRANGVGASTWLSAEDRRVCPACDSNEAAGPVPVGQNFPSGSSAPPAHPSCRCTLLPVVGS